MPLFATCSHCEGFFRPSSLRCPHCDAMRTPRRFSALGTGLGRVAASGAVAVTLMACYGAPMHQRAEAPTRAEAPCRVDADADGYCAELDCDDDDPYINPGLDDEAGDGIDRDCDGADGVGGAGLAPPAPAIATDPDEASGTP